MNESDLRALLPPDRPLPARRRRQMKEALMVQIHRDIEVDGIEPVEGTAPPTGQLAPTAGRGPRRRLRRGLLLAGAAAAATVVVVAATLAIGGSPEPTGSPGSPGSADRGGIGAPIRAERALAQTAEALVSGRAEYTVQFDVPGDPLSGVVRYGMSGDDRSVAIEWQVEGSVVTEDRVVDGELYRFTALRDDAEPRWYHVAGPDVADLAPELAHDPRALLDELQGAGPFEEVGTETVDGVQVRRLRATHPEATPPLGYPVRFEEGGITALELSVDETGTVRRVDASFGGQGGSTGVPWTGSASIRYFDLGQPITIEAPADAVDLPSGGLG